MENGGKKPYGLKDRSFFFYGYMHRLIQQAPAVCVVDSPLGSFAIDQGFGLSFSFAAGQKS